MNLKVCWMYHDIMDLYGDKGNISIQTLVDEGYIDSTNINSDKNCQMLNDYIKVTSDSNKYNYEYITVDGGC